MNPEMIAELDPGIRDAVVTLAALGVDTCQSCEGGTTHAYRYPTIDFLGEAVEPFTVMQMAVNAGLPVVRLSQHWSYWADPPEMVWSLELRAPDGGYRREYGRVLSVELVNNRVVNFEDQAIACMLIDDAREFARRIIAACDSASLAPDPQETQQMSADSQSDRYHSVACPTCGAEVGAYCASVNGVLGWHTERVDAAVSAASDPSAAQDAGADPAAPSPQIGPVDSEALARRFHEAYERLAPEHGYETRFESAVPWENVPAANKALMVAVCDEVGPLFASVVHECCIGTVAAPDAIVIERAHAERLGGVLRFIAERLDDSTAAVLREVAAALSPSPQPAEPEPPSACGAKFGLSDYMRSMLNADQADASSCRCALPAGHDGEHKCVEHDGVVPSPHPETDRSGESSERGYRLAPGFDILPERSWVER